MKAPLRSLLVLLAFAPVAFGATDAKQPAPSGGKSTAAPQRHPLKGVVTAVDADMSALRVKHEAIPGVMRAMTMLFKVDAATLKAVKPGDAITAQLSREGNEWRLHDVQVMAAKTN